jgi:hypothetical protein
MTTQYTSILKLALPVQGELSGTWGDVVNDNITSMVEEAVAGRAVINSWTERPPNPAAQCLSSRIRGQL